MIAMFHVDGDSNPADMLSEHWGYQQVWKMLQPLLFWMGDTADAGDSSKQGDRVTGKWGDGETLHFTCLVYMFRQAMRIA